MKISRYRSVVLLIASLVCFIFPTAHAWEFALEAGFSWNWYSGWQLGSEGFFGPYNLDASAQNLQNANLWAGANKWAGVFPHAHVSTNTMYMQFSPEFSINEAVRIRGKYYIGAWDGNNADRAASEYLNSSAPGTLVSFSPGYWDQLWASAQTPWGILVVGKRPYAFGLGGAASGFGIGGLASGEDCSSTESVALISSYGPMRIGMIGYPARIPDDASVALLNSDANGGAGFAAGSVTLQVENGTTLRSPHVSSFVTYRSGSMDIGFLWDYARWSVGSESLVAQNGLAAGDRLTARANYIPYDFYMNNLILYLKYVNGRVFFNAEADIMDSMTRRHRPLAGTYFTATSVTGTAGAGSLWQTGHVLAKRLYTQAGLLFGPAKFTTLFAWVEGYDRRHGVLIDRQGTGLWLGRPQLNGTVGIANWSDELPNGIIFYPYSYLLVFNYGGGNNHFNVQGDGYLVDAIVCAAKIDYAVAANLNIWASFLYADRLSKGYGWGYIRPDGEGNVTYQRQGTFANPSPAIPDSHLGWEVGVGVIWELLDGLILGSRVAYWQPGGWFKYACVSKTNSGWDAPGSGNNWGIAPDRTIDPVMGLEMVLGFEF